MDKNVNILIVDDDPKLRKTLSDILKAKGYTPITVATGKEALDRVKEEGFAIALVDLKLEDMSGLDVMKEIKESSPSTEYIVITGHASQESAIKAVSLGAYFYVQKPYDIEQLLVTIRRAIEKRDMDVALRESEEKYREVVETSVDGVISIDSQMKVGVWNTGAERIFGYTQEEMIEQSLMKIVPERYKKEKEKGFVEFRKSGLGPVIGKTLELQGVRKDGTEIPVELSVSSRKKNETHIATAIVRDITERKKTEDVIRESESQHKRLYSMVRLMCDNLPDFIWTKDLESRFIFANKACCEKLLNAKSIDEAIGKTDMYFAAREKESHPENSEYHTFGSTHTDFDLVVLETKKPQRSDEFGNVKGKFLHLDVYRAPFWDEKGTLIGTVGCAKDITKEKEKEKEKLQLESQLRQAQKMESVGRLAGGVAHDYNNALSVIIGFTELTIDDVDPNGPLRANLDEVLMAAKRAADITRQLLAFARKQTIAPRVLDLNENVESMLKMLQRLIGEDIDLAWLPGTSLWPVKMDPSQLDQILANLCVNARDAIEGVGKVTIETGTVVFDAAYCADHIGFVPGEFVKLEVSDNGCGMDKEVLDNIFEPFFTTKGLDKGTGLGLSITYGIVKQNNGFINVYSEPGKGTTIKIYLSRYEGKPVEIQRGSTVEISPSRGETVLLVEDDLSVLKLAHKILEELGYTVLIAGTPGEAMGLAEEHAGEIHLLVTDMIMPEMNGRELAERLQSLYPGLKCMFMSGYTANAIAHHVVLDEGVCFIQKPFSKRDLATTVRKALDEAKGSAQG